MLVIGDITVNKTEFCKLCAPHGSYIPLGDRGRENKQKSEHVVCYVRIRAIKKNKTGDFPGGAVVKNPPANAGDTGSIPGTGRSHMPRSN